MTGRRVAVIGAGTWGMTLGILLHRKGHRVALWDLNEPFVRALARDRENRRALPGIRLPAGLDVTARPAQALDGASVVVFATPVQSLSAAIRRVRARVPAGALVVNVAKGLDTANHRTPLSLLADGLRCDERTLAVLSGPSHAEEVSRRIPTAVLAASRRAAAARETAALFETPFFRVFTGADPVGVEYAGALKNVVAIAAGILDGLGAGDNTKAALITRGQHEIARLGTALGGRPETFWGLAGIGDLLVTCMSAHSRNRYVGEQIGRGRRPRDVLRGMVMVAEGVETCRAARALSRKARLRLPIVGQVWEVLFRDKPAKSALRDLLGRPVGDEWRGLARSGRSSKPLFKLRRPG